MRFEPDIRASWSSHEGRYERADERCEFGRQSVANTAMQARLCQFAIHVPGHGIRHGFDIAGNGTFAALTQTADVGREGGQRRF